MTKYVKLSGPVYCDCDSLRVDDVFDKDRGGFGIECVPVHRAAGMVSVVFGQEYFEIQTKTFELVIPAKRRSKQNQAEIELCLEELCGDYARKFLDRIGRNDLEVIENG